MKKIVIILLVLVSVTSAFAQKNLNDYKYVIVPYKYDFVNEKDKYQLNSLSQFLFKKYGFEAIMEDAELPIDLAKNRCLGLRSDVLKVKAFLSTKLKVELKDCDGNVVYTTKAGSTKEKDYKVAYTLALRGAFEDFKTVNYKYSPNEAILAKTTEASDETSKDEIQKLKEEITALREKQEEAIEKEEPIKKVEVEKKEPRKVIGQLKKEEPTVDVLYAQKINNGFQLVDKTPKVVMIMLETNLENVFLVKDKNAIVYKEDGFWYISKNDGNKPSIKTLNIKF